MTLLVLDRLLLWLVSLVFCLGQPAYGRSTIASTLHSEFSGNQGWTDFYESARGTDRLVENTADLSDAIITKLVNAARQMAGPSPTDAYKLAAIRKAIYVPGPWNYNRAFAYDHDDPIGRDIHHKLLATYIETKLGNCVTMPILFLIVADRMGLDVRLAVAPLHLFVRYRDPEGHEVNLETTSGGYPARTEWYRQQLPMTDKAIASGIYMRTLSRRETVAEMAVVVVDAMIEQHRWQDAIEVADAILAVNPREVYTMVKRGTAFGELLRAEFTDRYATPADVPAALRPRYAMLARENERAFHDAEALGWTAND